MDWFAGETLDIVRLSAVPEDDPWYIDKEDC